MSDSKQLNLNLIKLKDDEAIATGTKAIRYLVQRLHKAHDNPALATMVQALMQEHMKMMVMAENEGPSKKVNKATLSKRPGERGKSLSQEPSPQRRSPMPEDRSPK